MENKMVIEANKKMMLIRRGIMHHMLNKFGLHPGQPEMLMYVACNPGCLQRQMAEDAGVSAASVAASFKRMENAGLIRRCSDTADLRCNRAYITEKGEQALHECIREMESLNQVMLQGLSDEELTAFCACLKKITENLISYKKDSITCEKEPISMEG